MSQKNPILPRLFVLFPRGGSREIVEFWSEVYETLDTSTSSLADFENESSKTMENFGYFSDTKETSRLKTLSGGLIGVARHMRWFHNRHASVYLFFYDIGKLYYVSIRVVYNRSLSLLKLLGMALFAILVVLGIQIQSALTLDRYTYDNSYRYQDSSGFTRYYRPTDEELARDMLQYALTDGLLATLIATVIVLVSLIVLAGAISWWRTGEVFGFLRTRFTELDRDDLASIAHAAFIAVNSAADTLSLKVITPPENQTKPAFASVTGVSAQRRPRRI